MDDQCIDCDLCRETAPANFTRNDDGGHSYVYKQPESPEEEALCKEAMEACPVEAIGNDSDEAALGALASDLEQSVDRGGFEAFTITNKNRMASADAQNQPYTYSSLLPDCIVRNLEQGYSPMPTS